MVVTQKPLLIGYSLLQQQLLQECEAGFVEEYVIMESFAFVAETYDHTLFVYLK